MAVVDAASGTGEATSSRRSVEAVDVVAAVVDPAAVAVVDPAVAAAGAEVTRACRSTP